MLLPLSYYSGALAKSAAPKPLAGKPKVAKTLAKKPAASTAKLGSRAATPQDKLKADVTAFVSALNNKDPFFILPKHVWGARVGFFGVTEWQRWWRQEHIADEMAVTDVKIHKFTPTEAEASFSYQRYPKAPVRTVGPFTLKFGHSPVDAAKKEPKVWQFVPRAPVKGEFLRSSAMLWAIWMISQAPDSLEAFRWQVAVINLESLGVAATKFEQDFESIYAFSAEFQEEALKAYVQQETAWTIPGTKDKYLFNNRLSGKDPAQVAEPKRTILFYDGIDETPRFRHDGGTLVCFVDGHIELASAERFKTFLWQ